MEILENDDKAEKQIEDVKDDYPVVEVKAKSMTEALGSIREIQEIYPKRVTPEITSGFIRDLMSADEIFRGKDGKFVGWPLLREEELYAFILHYRFGEFVTDMPMGGSYQYEKIVMYNRISDPNSARAKLLIDFPLIDYIIELGQGHIVAAGGAITSALTSGHGGGMNDCDFFLIGFRPEEEEEATSLISSIVDSLEGKYRELKAEKKIVSNNGNKFIVARNKNTVTVYFPKAEGMYEQKLQFVMRAYPATGNIQTDISMVIGGFDLFSCAIAYYNKRFYATYAGAFSIAKMVNVVMTSRFSTSMIYRITKYTNRQFLALFPGTTKEKMAERSFNAKKSFRQKKLSMPIALPHIKLGGDYTYRNQGEEPNDYGDSVFDSDSYEAIIVNVKAILEDKEDQYVIFGHSWEDIFHIPKVRKTKIKAFLTKLFNSIIKAARELTGEQFPTQKLKKRCRALFHKIIERDILNPKQRNEEKKQDEGEDDEEEEGEENDEESSEEENQQVNIAGREILQKCLDNVKHLKGEKKYDNLYDEFLFLKSKDFNALCEYLKAEIIKYIEIREAAIVTNMRGKHFIDSKNPIRQHTSSHNPRIVSAKDWYGRENYVPFKVGFPDEIFIDLKYLFTRGQFKNIGNYDFKNVLMPYLARGWALGVVENVRKIAMENFQINMQHQYCSKIFATSHLAVGVHQYNCYKGHSNLEIRQQQSIPKIKMISIEIEPNEPKEPKSQKPKETKEERKIRLDALRERNAKRKEERLAQQAEKNAKGQQPEANPEADGTKNVQQNKMAAWREANIKKHQERKQAKLIEQITLAPGETNETEMFSKNIKIDKKIEKEDEKEDENCDE